VSGKRDLVPWEIVDMNPSPALSYERVGCRTKAPNNQFTKLLRDAQRHCRCCYESSHRASAMSLGETIKKTIVRATELDIKGF